MQIDSTAFILFFTAFFFLYQAVKIAWRPYLLLIASSAFYFFAGLGLLLLVWVMIGCSYLMAHLIEKQEEDSKARAGIFYVAVVASLLPLVSFKYHLGLFDGVTYLNQSSAPAWALPLGISYFTFQILSYLIKVNIGVMRPGSIVTYANFILFFPKVSLGPVMEPDVFVRQMAKQEGFNYERTTKGLKRVLWGAFKKVVVADSIGQITGYVLPNYEHLHAFTLVLGLIFYIVQLYADFSGYTDMAIGIAQMLGFDLPENFDRPFFSTSVTTYWRRWHMSLFSWFYAYIYNPISFTLRSWKIYGMLIAIFITFSVSGLWHGNTFNFWFWGFLQGVAIAFEMFTANARMRLSQAIGKRTFTVLAYVATFSFLTFSVVFFVMPDLNGALHYIQRVATPSNWMPHGGLGAFFRNDVLMKGGIVNGALLVALLVFLFAEHAWRGKDKWENKISGIKRIWAWVFYIALVFAIIYCSEKKDAGAFLYRNF